jgi:NADH dehydrogenase
MVDGAANVAAAAAQAGASTMVQVSALGADERSASDYARCKALGEKAVLRAFPKATILRPSIVVGPEDGFFNRFGGLPIVPLIGGGKTLFQPISVSDVADAVMAAVSNSAAQGQTYELAGPKTYSFKELMDLMQSITYSKAPQVHVPWGVAELIGLVGTLAPVPPLTRDQVVLLRNDNVATGSLPGVEALGVDTAPIETILPTYLVRFRNGGQYAKA